MLLDKPTIKLLEFLLGLTFKDYIFESSLVRRTTLRQTNALIDEDQRQQILDWFRVLRKKHTQFEPWLGGIGFDTRGDDDDGGDIPGLCLEVMQRFQQNYWKYVLPISPNHSHIILQLLVVAHGARWECNLNARVAELGYGAFADLIIQGIRREVLVSGLVKTAQGAGGA